MLFGIDLILIEPGTVATAMYDKGEKEDLSEFKQTEYYEALMRFQKYIVAEGRKGLPPERLGKAVHLALTTAKPKARYALDFAQTSSYEDARRRSREATRTQEAVASREWWVLTTHDKENNGSNRRLRGRSAK
jgi:hypothetical protein